MGNKKKKIKAYIDRIEDSLAVVYLGDNEDYKIDIPLKFLPANIKEDTKLTITFEINEEEKKETANEIEELRKKLMGNSWKF